MLPSALKLFVNTPQVIEKHQNLPIRKSKWKQNSNLQNQIALPTVLCQNCPKMIHTNINKINRLSLLIAKLFLSLNQTDLPTKKTCSLFNANYIVQRFRETKCETSFYKRNHEHALHCRLMSFSQK